MRPSWIVLILLFAFTSICAQATKNTSAFDKLLRSVFPSAKAKVEIKKKSTRLRKKILRGNLYVEVEPEWIARYTEQEQAWDYFIPDDDLIRFDEGKYIVPIVVYRHYEDMAKTPRRSTTPPPPTHD